jgi:hypothetical protein
VRIWVVPPAILCRQHLLGEHRELHALWHILSQDKKGYANHAETKRWRGKLAALYARHEALVVEMTRRGYQHASPLDPTLATGVAIQEEYVDLPAAQFLLLRGKGCACQVAEDPIPSP